MRHIGLWIPHSSDLCSGQFSTPTTLTRMSYAFVERTGVKLVPSCINKVIIDTTGLSSFQNAQYSGSFTPGGTKIKLTLTVAGTYSFQPIVQVNGTTYLSAAGTATATVTAFSSSSLVFSINPVAPGTVPANGIELTAELLF